MSEIIATVIVFVGLIFNVLGCVGLIRLPDIYNRLQAATKCVTLGTCMVLVGVMVLVYGSSPATLFKLLLCVVFILITSPTAAHALARGAHASGVQLWEKSVVDVYEKDHEPGIESKEQS